MIVGSTGIVIEWLSNNFLNFLKLTSMPTSCSNRPFVRKCVRFNLLTASLSPLVWLIDFYFILWGQVFHTAFECSCSKQLLTLWPLDINQQSCVSFILDFFCTKPRPQPFPNLKVLPVPKHNNQKCCSHYHWILYLQDRFPVIKIFNQCWYIQYQHVLNYQHNISSLCLYVKL